MTANGLPLGATTTPATPLTALASRRATDGVVWRARADRAAPPDRGGGAGTQHAAVGVEHDVRIEHGDERLEVTLAGGGEERVDDLALPADVDVGLDRGVGHAAASATRQLARRRRLAVENGAISSNGTLNMSWSTYATRSAGLSVSSTTMERQAD